MTKFTAALIWLQELLLLAGLIKFASPAKSVLAKPKHLM